MAREPRVPPQPINRYNCIQLHCTVSQTTITLSEDVKRRLRDLKPDDLTWNAFLTLLRDSLDADAYEAQLQQRYATAVQTARTGQRRPDLAAKLPDDTDLATVAAIHAFLERLDDEAGNHVREVILYGSVARGEADAASDVDLLVVWDDAVGLGRGLIQDLAHEVYRDHRIHLSVMTVDHATWQDKADWSFYRTVRQEGIRLV